VGRNVLAALEPKPWLRLDAGPVLEALAKSQAEPARRWVWARRTESGTPGLAGAALLAQGRVAHLMAFPITEAPEGSGAPRR
jgi:hypothetical protein